MNNNTPQQRTPEWHEQRRGKLTGSNVGAALGLNQYMTPASLMRRMVRTYHGAESEFNVNIATDYGTTHEQIAMLAYSQKTGLAVHDVGFLVSPDYGWLGTSPDGVVIDNDDNAGILVVKCPFGLRNDTDPVFKSCAHQPHYYAQVQIEMLCAQVNYCHFYQWSQYGNSLELIQIDRQWLDCNLPKLFAFYHDFLREIDNPAHLEPLLPVIDTAKASNLINEYDTLTATIDEATARKREILDELVTLAKKQNSMICGRKLQHITRPGAVNYAKVIKCLLPDADMTPYQGKPLHFWKLG